MSESTKRFIIRQRFLMIQAIRQGIPIAQVARQFGCSRKTIYKWLHRYTEGGLKNLLDQSRRPHGHPRTLEPSLARLIAKLRQQTHYGPVRLQWLLWERYQLGISRWGIYQVLKRQGLITRGRRRCKKDYRLYNLPKPGQEVQIDTKHLSPQNMTRRRWFQYTAVDDCTRIRVLRIYDELTLHHSLEFLKQLVAQIPFKIHAIRTDGGIEFTYTVPTPKIHPFTQACRKLGIEHRINRPGYPQANGKVERSHRTDNEEFYRVTPVDRWRTDLLAWEHRYNFQRAHQSLHGLSPMEFFLALQSNREGVTYVRG